MNCRKIIGLGEECTFIVTLERDLENNLSGKNLVWFLRRGIILQKYNVYVGVGRENMGLNT